MNAGSYHYEPPLREFETRFRGPFVSSRRLHVPHLADSEVEILNRKAA